MALMVLEGSGDSKRRDQRVGARGASSLKVTDAFWYALLAFLVTGSTWGYTSDDIWYHWDGPRSDSWCRLHSFEEVLR